MRSRPLSTTQPPVARLEYAVSYLTADTHLIRRDRLVVDLLHGHVYFEERRVVTLSRCSAAIFLSLLRRLGPMSQQSLWYEARLGQSDYQSLRVAVFRLRRELRATNGLLSVKTRASTYQLVIAERSR